MRLTVKVLPLTEENAQGPYQAEALAVFKQRDFAIPVNEEDTFEQVWRKVEDRYKNNYLEPQYAAFFTIKKLQDGYDCDLDLTDTVGSIFAEEAVKDRVIQVIPSFVNRLYSMPPTSNLRPNPHKRPRESSADETNKRMRNEAELEQLMDIDPAQAQPIGSVELDEDGGAGDSRRSLSPGARQPSERAQSDDSVILVSALRHDQPELTTLIKSESPELGVSHPRAVLERPAKPSGRLKKPAQSSYDMLATPPSGSRSRTNVGQVSHSLPKNNAQRRQTRSSMAVVPISSRSNTSSEVRDQQQEQARQTPSASRTSQRRSESRREPSMSDAHRMGAMLTNDVDDSTSVSNVPNTPVSRSKGGKTPITTGGSVSYSQLKGPQLKDLLVSRGLRRQKNHQRSNMDMVRRLMEFDEQHPDSPHAGSIHPVVQETPQRATSTRKKRIPPKSRKTDSFNVEEPSNSNHDSFRLGDATSDDQLRSPLPRRNQEHPSNDALALNHHNVAEGDNDSFITGLTQADDDALENGDLASVQPSQPQVNEAARSERPSELEGNALENDHSAVTEVPRSPSLEVVKNTDIENNPNEEDSIPPTNGTSRRSSLRSASYYLNGESSVWKRIESPTSEDEASRADRQAVEELLGTEERAEADKPEYSESDDETTSRSPSAPNSARSSPIALREPAQWLAQSPSPRRLDSDAESGASRASSRSQSPANSPRPPNGDDASDQNSNDSNSDSESEDEPEPDKVDVNRTPSLTPPSAPPSSLPLRSSIVPATQASQTPASASQPLRRSTRTNGGINPWFTSASQPLQSSVQTKSSFPSASQPTSTTTPTPGPTKRATRPATVYTSLKAMLNNTRSRPNGAGASKAAASSAFKTGSLASLTQKKTNKKLPTALGENSDDEDGGSESSSSSSDSEE